MVSLFKSVRLNWYKQLDLTQSSNNQCEYFSSTSMGFNEALIEVKRRAYALCVGVQIDFRNSRSFWIIAGELFARGRCCQKGASLRDSGH